MNCRTFSKSLKDYIAGELLEDVNEAMEKHMSKCEKCSMAYEMEHKSYKAINGMAFSQNDSFTSSRYEILQSIDKERYNKSFMNKLGFYMKRNSFKYALGTAAVIAIILLSSLAISQFKNLDIIGGPHVEDVPKTNTNVEKNTSPAGSNENNGTDSNTKDTPVNNSKDVPAANTNTKGTSTENPTQEIKSNNEIKQNFIYNNNKLGISFTIPASWSGKYTIKEASEGINIFFKPTEAVPEGSGLIFCIAKEVPNADEPLYKVGNQKNIVAKGISYVVDGPRDIGFPPEHKEYNDYKKLQADVPNVVKTIKVAK